MISPNRLAPSLLAALTLAAALAGGGSALAQGPGEEAVDAHGALSAPLILTAAQRNAIHNAVLPAVAHSASIRPSTDSTIPLAVGATVSPLAELIDLPDTAAAGLAPAGLLKYAIVAGDIVIVDSTDGRVVDVIRDGEKP